MMVYTTGGQTQHKGTGYHRILRLNNSIARNFERDFGSRYSYRFVSSPGCHLGINNQGRYADIVVYPNQPRVSSMPILR